MPIDRDLFEQGLDPQDVAIVEFLSSRSDQAYDFDELASQFREYSEEFLGRVNLVLRLESLVVRGLIEMKTLSGDTYYASAKPSAG